ncbi:MAG TPA: hypothetical protein VLE49_22115 [Anaerolineales bacterium]|nr:hypothetical protein [Anaerolineales bacterium]
MFAKASVPILLCALLLQACSPAPIPINRETTASAAPTLVASVEATAAPTATSQPTATPPPTVGPTATVWPPVFDLYSFNDIRDLDSFVVTINEKNTVNGKLTELTNTIGYIKEPYSAYNQNKYAGGVDRTYVVDGWTYSLTGSGDWYISAGSNDDLFSKADIPAANTEKLGEAQFAGQEDFQGIPAYHFVLAPVAEANTNSQLEGDFYLAQDGNYVLYSHWKETSSQGNFTQVYEVTESLSSINQSMEIKLPADMQAMAAAVKVPAEMGLPLPENSALERMIRYKSGIGVDLYYFGIPKMSDDEFLNFYRQLPTTDGWKVTHVGHVRLHQDDCEFTRECVMISKGSTQVILYYDGFSLRAEFDWPHLYSPL